MKLRSKERQTKSTAQACDGAFGNHGIDGSVPQVSSPSRRRVLQLIGGASCAPFLAACDTVDLAPQASKNKAHTAMLLPLTGKASGVAQVMQNSANLAGQGGRLVTYDTADTTEGAIAAARRAVEAGADLILGPLFANQTQAVLQSVPRDIPVVSFSNDAALANEGAFVTGVTPYSSTKSMFGFAAKQGVQSLGFVAPNGAFGDRMEQAVRALGSSLNIRVGQRLSTQRSYSDLGSDLRRALNGRLPDAVYVPAVQNGGVPAASSAGEIGLTAMGSVQWNGVPSSQYTALDGSYYPSPDPSSFRTYQLKYKDKYKSDAGILAGLAYDCAKLSGEVRKARGSARRALLRTKGFDGALGPYKFSANGTCTRGLAVLQITQGQVWPVSPAVL